MLGFMASNLEALVRRLEIAVGKLESAGSIASGSGGAAGQADRSAAPSTESSLAPSVAAFDELIDTAVTKFVEVAEAIGGPVREASKLLEEAFRKERTVVLAISQCKVSPAYKLLEIVLREMHDWSPCHLIAHFEIYESPWWPKMIPRAVQKR